MTTVGRSNIEITATDRQARRTISSFFRDLENTGQRIGQAMQRMNPFETIEQGANQSTQFLERYKSRFLAAIDQMNAKATQSKKMMDILPETSSIQRIDRFFLGIGDRLEQMAKQGTAANLAITMLGRNASLKEILDRIKLINQGLARMQALATTSAIVLGLFTTGMVKLSNTVDGRLVPAVQAFKRVWLSALKPFAQIWTDFALKVIQAGTAIGRFIERLNQINPAITKMAGMFLYLFTAITLFLSPMAIGIGRALGMRAAFTVLFNTFKPLILGFLRVAGMASLISAALVILGGILIRLWQNSEVFRNAIIQGWNAIKNAVMSAVQPLIPSLQRLWSAFVQLLNAFTGGGLTVGDFWKSLGDSIGRVIHAIVQVGVPLLQGALQVISIVLGGIVDGLTKGFQALQPFIEQTVHYLEGLFSGIQGNKANSIIKEWRRNFASFLAFLKPIMGQIVQIIGQAFQLIGQIIKVAVMVWGTEIKIAWTAIEAIFSNPTVISVIQPFWIYIKTVISNALSIILNVLKLFSNLLAGNWEAAWQNLQNIVERIVTILASTISTSFQILLTIFASVWSAISSLLTRLWNRILSTASAIWGEIVSFFVGVWNGIVSFATSIWTSLVTFLTGLWNGLMGIATVVWNAITSAIVTAFTWMYNHNYYFQALVDTIVAAWNIAKQWTINTWNAITSFLTSAWNQLRSIASSTWNGMKSVILAVWNTVKPWLVSVWNSLRSVATSVWNGIRSVISSVVSGLRAVVTSAWNSIKAATSSAFNSVKSTVTSIWNSIKSMLSGLANQAAAWGRNLLNNFVSGIKSRFSALVKVVKDAASTVAAYLGFHSPAEKGPGADADKWFVNLMEMLENSIRIRVPHLRAAVLDAAEQLNAITVLNLGGTLQRAGIVSASTSESSVQQVHNEVHIYAQEAPLTEERLIRYLRRMDWLR
ncbi:MULTISPECIES: hypothetical protein [unclassified Thermoactinomyces]|uniref:hypothetical protein n=1 Tax=unclassified Thermoactinomyces TaxID=2634588 RepID=UPI0018DD083F|nr:MULTISPECIES: hypothetical protein [unclassified Thermoactinomyces]MBH8599066.1 hypothetical protein [Thermoactinomyces sp. CICC 10523]MBH8608003.1 hypothetical protein [Thermoactinomyces sp. CICC 10521]